ncbi:alpha/beta hydrolase [Streptomyces sp. NPDC021056]|uniref:alpha/beta fold hydrolase n=1 Tax=Streptomyces sp. NPDC021056 TaxID=3155012 RepID=UPI0033E5E7A7
MAAMLEDRATVVRWDQRGCGRSERGAGPWTTDGFVEDLDSWGAQPALSCALAHPERVGGLMYVGGTGIDPVSTWRGPFEANFRARLGEVPERFARWQESADGDRERAMLQWSVDFENRERALEHAGRMADPWFGSNFDRNKALGAETKQTWGSPELYAACQGLEVPVLIVDGERDVRPRWAVDSPERALPRVRRVVLPGAGHAPWVEGRTASGRRWVVLRGSG